MITKIFAEAQALNLLSRFGELQGLNTEAQISTLTRIMTENAAASCIENEKVEGYKNGTTYVLIEHLQKNEPLLNKLEAIGRQAIKSAQVGQEEAEAVSAMVFALKEHYEPIIQNGLKDCLEMRMVLIRELLQADWVQIGKDIYEQYFS
jgi:hypothetical protein